MARYGVTLFAHASTIVEVDADSPDEAREKARAQVDVTLCHQCAHHVSLDDFEDDEDDPGTVFSLEPR